VPNVVGAGDRVGVSSIDLGGLEGKRRRGFQEPDIVSFDGMTYLVGANVSTYTDPVQRGDDSRFDDTPLTRCVTYATFCNLLGPGEHEGYLTLALPIHALQPIAGEDVKRRRREIRRQLRGIKEWMVADHVFSVNENDCRVRIKDIRFMAQPTGAFFDWGLDLEGQWVRTKDDFEAECAIIDWGFMSVDLFVVQSGVVSPRYTDGRKLGMRRAAEELQRQVGSLGRELALPTANKLIVEHIRHPDKPLKITAGGQRQDIRPLAALSLNSSMSAAIDFIGTTWAKGDFLNVLFTGGGSIAHAEQLRKQINHGILLDDAVTANARGLAKFAARPGVWNAN